MKLQKIAIDILAICELHKTQETKHVIHSSDKINDTTDQQKKN